MSDTETKPALSYTLTEPVQIAYPIFFADVAQQARSRGIKVGDWGGQLLLNLESLDYQEIRKLLAKAAADKWPGRALNTIHFPLQKGDDLAEKDSKKQWASGYAILKVKSPMKDRNDAPRPAPPVFSISDPNTPITNSSLLVSGSFVAAALSFKGNSGNGSNIPDSVTAYVNRLLIVKPGPRIGGADNNDVFKGVIGAYTNDDPTAGMATSDDEIPF